MDFSIFSKKVCENVTMYYLCSGNKRAGQLHGYHAADLCHVFPYVKSRFSDDAAQIRCILFGSEEDSAYFSIKHKVWVLI